MLQSNCSLIWMNFMVCKENLNKDVYQKAGATYIDIKQYLSEQRLKGLYNNRVNNAAREYNNAKHYISNRELKYMK